MTELEFMETLPTQTTCEVCGRDLLHVVWTLRRQPHGEWMGIGVVKCPPCSYVRMAAAGSDDAAFRKAIALRLDFMKKQGVVH